MKRENIEAVQADKPAQQWEMLASPGHVLLEQVDTYRLKTRMPTVLAGCAAALVYLTFIIVPYLGSGAGAVAGWVTGAVSSIGSKKPLEVSIAPALRELIPVIPSMNLPNPETVPKLDQVAPEMDAQVAAMKAGKKITDCDFGKKITENWTDGVDMTPKCRYSKDGERLWIWALVNDRNQYKPFIGVIVKSSDGEVRYMNPRVRGAAFINGKPTLDLQMIPRAVAADFPELAL